MHSCPTSFGNKITWESCTVWRRSSPAPRLRLVWLPSPGSANHDEHRFPSTCEGGYRREAKVRVCEQTTIDWPSSSRAHRSLSQQWKERTNRFTVPPAPSPHTYTTTTTTTYWIFAIVIACHNLHGPGCGGGNSNFPRSGSQCPRNLF